MGRLVKILQVQCVVPHLINRVPMKPLLTDLELNNKNKVIDDQDHINPTTDARQYELKKYVASAAVRHQSRLQHSNLFLSGTQLGRFNSATTTARQRPADCISRRIEKRVNRCLIVGAVQRHRIRRLLFDVAGLGTSLIEFHCHPRKAQVARSQG